MKNKVKILDAASMVLLLLLSVVFIFPFYWILTGAFKSQKVTIKLPPEWFPLHPTLENFEKLFQNPALQWADQQYLYRRCNADHRLCGSLYGRLCAGKEALLRR